MIDPMSAEQIRAKFARFPAIFGPTVAPLSPCSETDFACYT